MFSLGVRFTVSRLGLGFWLSLGLDFGLNLGLTLCRQPGVYHTPEGINEPVYHVFHKVKLCAFVTSYGPT